MTKIKLIPDRDHEVKICFPDFDKEKHSMTLEEWLSTCKDGDQLKVIRNSAGHLWLQNLTANQVYMTDINC